MKASVSKRIEKNIYVESRSGSFRSIVAVYPLERETRTASPDEYNVVLQWARRRRVELLENKAANKAGLHQIGAVFPSVAAYLIPQDSHPEAILLQDIFDAFRRTELGRLAGEEAEACRLKKLAQWFGQLTLGQLDYAVIDQWKSQRLSGLLGSGRNPNRGVAQPGQLQSIAERKLTDESGMGLRGRLPSVPHYQHIGVSRYTSCPVCATIGFLTPRHLFQRSFLGQKNKLVERKSTPRFGDIDACRC